VGEEENGSVKDPQISSISWLSSSIFQPEEGEEEEKRDKEIGLKEEIHEEGGRGM
jgi:hypothetical protein